MANKAKKIKEIYLLLIASPKKIKKMPDIPIKNGKVVAFYLKDINEITQEHCGMIAGEAMMGIIKSYKKDENGKK